MKVGASAEETTVRTRNGDASACRKFCCRRELRNRVETGRVESGEAFPFFFFFLRQEVSGHIDMRVGT